MLLGADRRGDDRVQLGRQRHAELGEQGGQVAIDLAGLPDARAVVFVLDDLDAIELVDDVAPGVAGADLGDALDE